MAQALIEKIPLQSGIFYGVCEMGQPVDAVEAGLKPAPTDL